MMSPYRPGFPRPSILTPITVVSVLLSIVDVFYFVILALVATGIMVFSWLGGPVAGAAGAVIGGGILLIGLIRFLLSFLLFLAAWKTWHGEPAGQSLHRTWAWSILVIDALDLLLTGGMSPAGWWGLIYALAVLYVMNQPDVQAYFDRGLLGPYQKPSGLRDDDLAY